MQVRLTVCTGTPPYRARSSLFAALALLPESAPTCQWYKQQHQMCVCGPGHCCHGLCLWLRWRQNLLRCWERQRSGRTTATGRGGHGGAHCTAPCQYPWASGAIGTPTRAQGQRKAACECGRPARGSPRCTTHFLPCSCRCAQSAVSRPRCA